MRKLDIHYRAMPWLVAGLVSAFLAGCGGGKDPILGSGGIGVLAPTVVAVAPLPQATDVNIKTKIVTATFSKPMNSATLTPASFTLACPLGTAVTGGVVSYLAATDLATLTLPAATDLPANTTCTGTVTTAAKDTDGLALASNFVWTFVTGAIPDIIAPTVTGTIHTDGQINVAFNTKVGATFSEVMDPLTITNANFTLKEAVSGAAVAGTMGYAGVNALFTPLSNLTPDTRYTVTVKGGASGVKDLAGNAMASDFVISWTTGPVPDTTAPFVTGTINANGATNVFFNSKVGATFSEGMNPLTVTNLNFSLKESVSGAAVPGVMSYSGVNAVFVPLANLAPFTRYTGTFKSGASGVKDLAGNAMASDYVWSWTTGVGPDIVAPTVSATVPVNAANASVATRVTARFSEAMDPLTITTANFALLARGITPVSGTIAYDLATNVMTFTPLGQLSYSTPYTALVRNKAKDLAGNALAGGGLVPNPWNFTTENEPPPPPPPPPPAVAVVNLGRAVNFAVLAGTGISNTNPTTVTGDVGAGTQTVAPTVTAGYTNYQNVGDQALIDALADMPAAIADANGRTCSVSSAGAFNSFSGQSVAPGVYCYGGAINVTGTLNLNGAGVYVFRTASTLDTVASAIVNFTGGATGTNTSVFWVPVGATTIGTLSTFKGTVLSAAAMTVGMGATLQNGRVLSTAHVTLSNNVISRPFP